MKERGAKAINVHGGPYTEAGTPDIIGCYRGEMLVIELKAPGGELMDIQKHRLAEWEEAGARVWLCRSVAEIIVVLDLIDDSEAKYEEKGS